MIFKRLQFDDIDSLEQGVYITGEAVYNSPERDVELVAIPGRNGELARDKDRFLNIEVTYPAGAKRKNKQDFAEIISQFRNLMKSKRGYKRLVDDYNPNEYRLGIFKEAIEVEATGSQNAGEFDLIFNCKPQRFLMSGESAISVSDGESIFNPTPFNASPMVLTEGYGTLTVNGYEIEIVNEYLGEVILSEGGSETSYIFNASLVNPGDDIIVDGCTFVTTGRNSHAYAVTSLAESSHSGESTTRTIDNARFTEIFGALTFTAGTAQTYTSTTVLSVTVTPTIGTAVTYTPSVIANIEYDGVDKFTFSWGFSGSGSNYLQRADRTASTIMADSTVSTLGHPTYIDCDLGEVYKIDNGSLIPLNRLTDLGSRLPVLSAGNNLVEYDNTFTDVQIIPRWWIV